MCEETIEFVPFAYQCPTCCEISEIPCFEGGCNGCGQEDNFTILYIKRRGKE